MERATTAEFFPGQDTFDFDQGHVTKNQSIKVFLLLNESQGIQQHRLTYTEQRNQGGIIVYRKRSLGWKHYLSYAHET